LGSKKAAIRGFNTTNQNLNHDDREAKRDGDQGVRADFDGPHFCMGTKGDVQRKSFVKKKRNIGVLKYAAGHGDALNDGRISQKS